MKSAAEFAERVTYGTVGFMDVDLHQSSQTAAASDVPIPEEVGSHAAGGQLLAKPKLRGMLHLITTPLVLLGGLALMIVADTVLLRVGCAVWTVSAIMLFGHSAVYHRGRWTAKVEKVLRRIDHSNIAIFIAGTYTPLTLALLTGSSRIVLLSVIWGCALLEVVFRTLWLGAPRWLYVALYLVMGWAAVLWLPSFWASGGPAVVLLMVAGGLWYSVGAIIYARKRPNPSAVWFGFHELFHAGTILGAACHWVAILLAVL